MSTFQNAKTAAIGATEAVLYTPPTGKKSIAIGVLLTNTYIGAIGVDVYIKSSGVITSYLGKDIRVDRGANMEFIQGKIVLASGDSICAVCKVAGGFSGLISVLEDVQ